MERSLEQLILGTLLGDGCISYSGTKLPRYRVGHSYKQAEYVDLKYEMLKAYVRTGPKTYAGRTTTTYNFETTTSVMWLEYYNLCYSIGKKLVTKEWLDKLTPEGLAYWYMDDGGLTSKSLRIATYSFGAEEMELLVSMLCGFGINSKIVLIKNKYLGLHFDAENRNKFISIISPYIIPSMAYKIDIRMDTKDCSICGTTFVTGHGNKLTCSDICAHRHRNNRIHRRQKRLREEAKQEDMR